MSQNSFSSSGSRPLSPRPTGWFATGCLGLFGLVFLLAGLAAIIFGTLRPLWLTAQAQRWAVVPCQIVSSAVEKHHSSKGGPTYSVNIHYRYVIADHPFESNRYDFTTGSSSGFDAKQAIVSRYAPGSESTCYVNPSDPAAAALSRQLSPGIWTGLFGIPFALIGGLICLAPFWSKSRARTRAGSTHPVVPGAVPRPSGIPAGPVPLHPSLSPVGKFFGLLAFGLFWNGFIVLFGYLVMRNEHGHLPLMLEIFGGVFLLIGLAILSAAASSFLAIFNPRVKLTASSDAVPLGGELRVDWVVDGKAEKLKKLRISLEGREEATYRQNKSSSTATHVFADELLVEATNPEQIRAASARVIVPAGSIHTLLARHNRIIWRLRVRGEIPGWPDVDDEYTINVLPLPRNS